MNPRGVPAAFTCRSMSTSERLEIVARARADANDLRALGVDATQVLLSGPLGEFHSGRAVRALRGLDGRGVLYKPRSLRLAEGLRLFLRFLHSHGIAEFVRAPQSITKPSYGWQAEIRSSPPVPESFSEALGQLTAIAWLLGSVDLTCENVVWHRGAVHVVDEETVLQPRHGPQSPRYHFSDRQRRQLAFYGASGLYNGLLPKDPRQSGAPSAYDAAHRAAHVTPTRASDARLVAAQSKTLRQLRVLATEGTLQRASNEAFSSSALCRVLLASTRSYTALHKPIPAFRVAVCATALPVAGGDPIQFELSALAAMQQRIADLCRGRCFLSEATSMLLAANSYEREGRATVQSEESHVEFAGVASFAVRRRPSGFRAVVGELHE